MHVICDVGAMSDVRGRDHTVPDTAGSGWMYESESGMCGIDSEFTTDGRIQSPGGIGNRCVGRRMQYVGEEFF